MRSPAFDVNRLRIASPCSMRWEDMEGDERSRHCAACKLSVLNVAGMTRAEVAEAVRLREGRLCMRLLRRADGTVITKDCPVGASAVRARIARAVAACLAMFGSAAGLSWLAKQEGNVGEAHAPQTGKMAVPPETGAVASPRDLHGMTYPECNTKPVMGELPRDMDPAWYPIDRS